MLDQLRNEVSALHLELPKNNLVSWTSGNISALDESTQLVVIKASGIKYDDITPHNLVVVDLMGNIIEGNLRPSVDCASHLYIYKHMPHIRGIVHTHSPYATAFAIHGKEIPCLTTAMADEFGGSVQCAPYASVGSEDIGRSVVDHIGSSTAILLKNHGVFTIGKSPEKAVKSAVMVEDVAKTTFLALQLGIANSLPEDEIKRAHHAYINLYGQK